MPVASYLKDPRLYEYMMGEKSHKVLFLKLKQASYLPENSAFKPQLTALIAYCEYLDDLLEFENGAIAVIKTLLLIEDTLDKKLTHEEFKLRVKEMSTDESPLLATLSLLLFAFGLALTTAGFLIVPAGVPLIAAGAIAQTTVFSGLLCSIAGGVGFFRYNPSQISTLSDDFGKAYYNATSSI